MIFDVAGFPEIRGRDLVASLVKHAEQYGPTYLLGRPAVALSDTDGALLVDVGEGEQVQAGAVLILVALVKIFEELLAAEITVVGETAGV